MLRNLFRTWYLLLMFVVAPGIPHVDAGISDIANDLKNSVVTVRIYDGSGKPIISGSGFIVDQSGVIATDCLVIAKWFEKAENILDVELHNGAHLRMEDLISSQCENHLALFSVNAKGLSPVKLDAHYPLKQGEDVVVIGGPSMSSKHAVSWGKIKGLRGKKKSFAISNHLSSELDGSPVFNMQGSVIGAVVFQTHKAKTLSFAASIAEIAGRLDRYRKSKPPVVGKPVISPPSAKIEEHLSAPPVKLPDDPKEFFSLGCAYDLKRLYRNAIEAYQKSIRMKPDFPDAHINLGVDFYKLGEYGNAVNAFNRALQLTPDSVSVCNKLASAYILEGSFSMAVETLKKAIDIDPKNIASRFNLGIAYYLKGDFTAAFDQYRILKEIDKEQADRLMDVIFSD